MDQPDQRGQPDQANGSTMPTGAAKKRPLDCMAEDGEQDEATSVLFFLSYSSGKNALGTVCAGDETPLSAKLADP